VVGDIEVVWLSTPKSVKLNATSVAVVVAGVCTVDFGAYVMLLNRSGSVVFDIPKSTVVVATVGLFVFIVDFVWL